MIHSLADAAVWVSLVIIAMLNVLGLSEAESLGELLARAGVIVIVVYLMLR